MSNLIPSLPKKTAGNFVHKDSSLSRLSHSPVETREIRISCHTFPINLWVNLYNKTFLCDFSHQTSSSYSQAMCIAIGSSQCIDCREAYNLIALTASFSIAFHFAYLTLQLSDKFNITRTALCLYALDSVKSVRSYNLCNRRV